MASYAVLTLLACAASGFFGCFVLLRSSRGVGSVPLFLFCVTEALLNFVRFQLMIAESVTRAELWLSFIPVWPFAFAFLFHFALLCGDRGRVSPRTAVLIYAPTAAVSLMWALSGQQASIAGWAGWAWEMNFNPTYVTLAFFCWGVLLGALALLVSGMDWLRAQDSHVRQQSGTLFAALTIFLLIAGITPAATLLGYHLPPSTSAGVLAALALVAVQMWRYGAFARRIVSRPSELNHYTELGSPSILSFRDSLTGLSNRTAFYDLADSLLQEHSDNGRQFALLYMDFDFFKEVNVAFGNTGGNELLSEFTYRLHRSLRRTDHAFRMGGDEFMIVTTNIDGEESASSVAQKILGVLEKPFRIQEVDVHITMSLGLSIYPRDGTTIDELVSHASEAQSDAKRERNSYRFFSGESHMMAGRRIELMGKLRNAIAAEEFSLLGQPIVDLSSGKVSAVEMLLRWDSGTDGSVSPARFIPIAEETGLIVSIGQWVLRESCRVGAMLAYTLGEDIEVGLNISVKQLRHPDFAYHVQQALAESGLPPTQLTLEITESVFMDDYKDAVEKLMGLRAIGVEIALDDFGTGYSSLSHLRHIPVDSVKIDRAFISGLPQDRKLSGITRSIVMLIESIGLRAIAEGVETKEQSRFLQEYGCRFQQGYLHSRPMSSKELLPYILNYNGNSARSAGGDHRQDN